MEFSSLEKISNIFFLRGVLKMVTRVLWGAGLGKSWAGLDRSSWFVLDLT